MADWKKIVGAVAPTLATALGGPLAGVATRAIAGKLLGKDATDAEVEAAVAGATPETILKLKELDIEFQQHMVDAGIELERLDAGDRANARAREVSLHDWVPSVLACAVCLAFFTLLFLLVRVSVPPENKDLFTVLLGGLGGAVTTVLTYYFGSSRGSSAKDQTIGKLIKGDK